jgi:hypothetical protein
LNQTITKTANTLEKMFFLTVAFKLVEDDQQNVLESKPKQLRNTKNTERVMEIQQNVDENSV